MYFQTLKTYRKERGWPGYSLSLPKITAKVRVFTLFFKTFFFKKFKKRDFRQPSESTIKTLGDLSNTRLIYVSQRPDENYEFGYFKFGQDWYTISALGVVWVKSNYHWSNWTPCTKVCGGGKRKNDTKTFLTSTKP